MQVVTEQAHPPDNFSEFWRTADGDLLAYGIDRQGFEAIRRWCHRRSAAGAAARHERNSCQGKEPEGATQQGASFYQR